MKKFLALVVAIFSVFAIANTANAAVPSSVKGIKVNKFEIKSISPASLTSVNGTVKLNVTNTNKKVTVTNISGIVYAKDGSVFITGTANDFTLENGTQDIEVTGTGTLGSLSAFRVLLSSGFSLKPADYTVDVNATVKVGRKRAQKIELKKVPLSKILKK